MSANFQNKNDLQVLLSGQCKKCRQVIGHVCPNFRTAIKASQRGGNMNLIVGDITFECHFCPEPIVHDHKCFTNERDNAELDIKI